MSELALHVALLMLAQALRGSSSCESQPAQLHKVNMLFFALSFFCKRREDSVTQVPLQAISTLSARVSLVGYSLGLRTRGHCIMLGEFFYAGSSLS